MGVGLDDGGEPLLVAAVAAVMVGVILARELGIGCSQSTAVRIKRQTERFKCGAIFGRKGSTVGAIF